MTNQRPFSFSVLVLVCIVCVWYLMENMEQTATTVDKDGLVPPREITNNLDLDRLVEAKEVTVQTDHVITCPPWNTDDFPVVNTRTLQAKDDIQTSQVFSRTISPEHTIIEIVNQKPMYELCDKLVVRIIARDWNRTYKTYGGDFFRMKIFSEKLYSATSEDKLIDFNNGTYLAYFTLRWSGQVKVQVKVVHPVEILPEMELNLRGLFGANHTFVGKFTSKASGAKEERLCRYFHSFPGPCCNLSNKHSHGPWFCQKPQNPNLTCDDWRFHQLYTNSSFLNFEAHLSSLSLKLLEKSYMANIKNQCSITVRDQVTSDDMNINESHGMPYCSMKGLPKTVETNGHFYKGRWYPNDCRVHDFSEKDLISCVAHKQIILLGDSTTRQLFYYFKDTFLKTFKVLTIEEKICWKQGPITLRNETLNSSIHFHFHGLPIFLSKGLVLRTDFIQYVADALDSMGSGLSHVVVISVWSHFLGAGKEFYINRWIGIKSAIQRFLDRNPEAKIIIKSGNTRNVGHSWGFLISSMWNVFKFEGYLRQLFEGEQRVGFVDAFDITRVQPFADNVHPNTKVVKEIVNRILTYICKN